MNYGSAGGVGPGANGVAVSVYAGVIWNAPTLEDYDSNPVPSYSLGVTAGVGLVGFTHTYFYNPAGKDGRGQFGQWSGFTFAFGAAKFSVGGAGTKSQLLLDANVDAETALYLSLAWPPPYNILLRLKQIGFIRNRAG